MPAAYETADDEGDYAPISNPLPPPPRPGDSKPPAEEERPLSNDDFRRMVAETPRRGEDKAGKHKKYGQLLPGLETEIVPLFGLVNRVSNCKSWFTNFFYCFHFVGSGHSSKKVCLIPELVELLRGQKFLRKRFP